MVSGIQLEEMAEALFHKLERVPDNYLEVTQWHGYLSGKFHVKLEACSQVVLLLEKKGRVYLDPFKSSLRLKG